MSQGNVEIVERIYAAADTPLAFEFYAPDIEWDLRNYHGWVGKPVYRGHEGVREFMVSWVTSFERWEPTLERAIPSGDDVVAIINDRAYSRGSTTPIVRHFAHTFTFRDGSIVRASLYSDIPEALEAAGVSER
jgi:ketosteroid isomerase-like protein